MKEVKFLESRCTSLLLRSKPVQQNSVCFFKKLKTVRALRLNTYRYSNFDNIKCKIQSVVRKLLEKVFILMKIWMFTKSAMKHYYLKKKIFKYEI